LTNEKDETVSEVCEILQEVNLNVEDMMVPVYQDGTCPTYTPSLPDHPCPFVFVRTGLFSQPYLPVVVQSSAPSLSSDPLLIEP